ncbi:unnamed protein product [Fusarium equiseti]|uniref:Major facilitator superfamily (MFS) profile domain-containing protein n=1 Tax=Fusarium equiseti TaxID=61235 RepID=A0A8J2NK68_FUSEQ|nr:unnamed protein product [Fusarium equiseti]
MAVKTEEHDGPTLEPIATLRRQGTRSEMQDLEIIASAGASFLPNTIPPPPDGGLHAWTQVAMGWIVIFATWGYVNSFGSFQAHYTSILPQTPFQISWIGSIQVWFTFFGSAFSGRLLDAGFWIPTFLVGSTLQLLGIFTMSLSTSYWHLMITQGIVTGIGGGIIFAPSLALVATYFEKRRGIAIGLVTTGNSLGGTVYPLVVRTLLPEIGFSWTSRVLGFINLAGFVLVAVFMRPRLPPRQTGPIIDWSAFKDALYVSYVSGLFFFVWSVYYTFYYLASFGQEEVGMSFADSSILTTIINAVGLPTRVLIPFLADRIGPLNTIAPAGLCVAIVAYTWLAVHNETGVYLFSIFYGIASGAFQSLMPTGVASITKRLDTIGTRMGMCFSLISFAGLSGPPIGGLLQSKSLAGAHVWAALSSTLAAVLLVVARVLKVGWKMNLSIILSKAHFPATKLLYQSQVQPKALSNQQHAEFYFLQLVKPSCIFFVSTQGNMASSEQSLSLRPKASDIPHPLPSLTEHELGPRLTVTTELLTEIQTYDREFIMRVEQVALILLVGMGEFDHTDGLLSTEIWQPRDLKRRLERASPFCKHYMLHLNPDNLANASWRHALYRAPLVAPPFTFELIREADWGTLKQSMYYEKRFEIKADLQDLSDPVEESAKCRKHDKDVCAVSGNRDPVVFWFVPRTWNDTKDHTDATGNLADSSLDVADVNIMDDILSATELGKTHKAWNMVLVDQDLYACLVQGLCAFKFEAIEEIQKPTTHDDDRNGDHNDEDVHVVLRFYWMPRLTPRFNRVTTVEDMKTIATEFNAFIALGSPPPDDFPKSIMTPKSGDLVRLLRTREEAQKLKSAVKIHWSCIAYTALCGGVGLAHFMTGMDQGDGSLQPRDEEFRQEAARDEFRDGAANSAQVTQ